MFPLQSGLFYVEVFGSLAVLLAVVGLLGALWIRAGFLGLAAVLRAAHRAGLYDPDGGRETTTPDRGLLALGRWLQSLSASVPGTRTPRTLVVPMLLVGVPLGLLTLVFLWAVPFALVGFVWTRGPAPWSGLLAFLAVAGYFGCFLLLWRYWRAGRIPVVSTV